MDRGWTVAQLAERAGVSEKTVRNVERGALGVALGTAFDCAVLVGIRLFDADERELGNEAERRQAALIGRRVRSRAPETTDLDF